jgi:hypothetical protein
LRLFAFVVQLPLIHFDPHLYRNYLLSRHGQHLNISLHENDLDPHQSTGDESKSSRSTDEFFASTLIAETELWGIFFDQIYYVGLWAAHSHDQQGQARAYITRDEIELQEPYLYIGLPAVSLLNMILRSRYDFSHEFALTSLRLIDGRLVTAETCPASYQKMFRLLIETKREMLRLEPPLRVEEMDWLREAMLYAAAEKELQGLASLCLSLSLSLSLLTSHCFSLRLAICLCLAVFLSIS